MNEKIIFWRTWYKADQIILKSILIFLSILILYTLVSWGFGFENVVHWNTISELKEKIITTNIFSESTFSFSTSSPLWYVKERYAPSLITINSLAYLNLLFSGLIGFVFIILGLSRLKGFWFLFGATLIASIFISLRLENVFLSSQNVPFLLIFVAFGVYYYVLNIYKLRFTTLQGISIGLLILIVFLFICYRFSAINKPLMSMAAYSLVVFLIITAVFIFLISHEILAGLVWLVSKNSTKNKSSLNQFLIISVIYLLNVILVYFENSNRIEESFFVMHPVLIFLISIVLGFWGFKKAVEQQEWFSFQRVGVWIYLGLALISTSCVALIYASANDPLQELLSDFIAISQLGVGLSFFVYVLINYMGIFKQGLEVQKILYKSPFSRLLLSRVASVFIIFLLFSFKNYYSYYQAQAGLNNAIADFYLEEGDLKSAETFYKVATQYDLYNHKSNFSIASMALSQDDKINAAFFFKQALQKNPSALAYAGLSMSLESEEMYFDAIFTLQEGIKNFPHEGKLYTNLADLQGKAKVTDSLIINLDKALQLCNKCEVENTNYLAFGIENADISKLESMAKEAKPNTSYSYLANEAAVLRLLDKPIDASKYDTKDTTLNVSKAAYLFNITSSTKSSSKIEPNSILNLQQDPANDLFFEELSWAYSNQSYYRENKLRGIKQMAALAGSKSKLKNIYGQNLGIWLLKEGVYDQSIARLKASGDSSSVKILESNSMKERFEVELQNVSNEVLKTPLTLENYESTLDKAPLNPFVVSAVSDFLDKNKKNLEAYKVAFYASEINSENVLLIKTYIKRALAISQVEYAEDGLARLKSKVSTAEYNAAKLEIENFKSRSRDNVF